MKVLAGDIGGTKTLLQVAEVHGNEVEVIHRTRFSSQAYDDFESLLGEFLEQLPAGVRKDVTNACFGVAGPIRGDEQEGTRYASVTNLPWQLDENGLQTRLSLPHVHLINDLYATACGIEALREDDLSVLQAGKPQRCAPRLVVGAGTGLGVAQLFWCNGRYQAFASEGGHIHFAPRNALQAELLEYMQGLFDRVSYERLVSGNGLTHIYTFLVQRDRSNATSDHASVLDSPDPAAEVARLASEGDTLASQAVDLFITLYGAVAGDLALVCLAYGGVYISGGIAPKLLHEMSEDGFMTAYKDKGRMSPLAEQTPVYIVLNQDVGLLGASLVASQI